MQEYKFLGGATNLDQTELSVADRFRLFMQEAEAHKGYLYEAMSDHIASDPEILEIASHVKNPPIPNAFFAAVHYLLLQDKKNKPPDPLIEYYGSITAFPFEWDEAYPAFRNFVLRHRDQLSSLLETVTTQTNEVGRCSYLLPAFQTVFAMGGNLPLALIDAGCSAGLHLLWDLYQYDYDCGRLKAGNPRSRVKIKCELRGRQLPPIPQHLPPCTFRIGIDLKPINLEIGNEKWWLRSFIFPDMNHAPRRKILEEAMQMCVEYSPAVVQGDVIETIPQVVRQLVKPETLCVYHSHSMYQLDQNLWNRFEDMMLTVSEQRDVFWIIAEGYELHLRHLRRGVTVRNIKLANKAAHGDWLEWGPVGGEVYG